MKIKRPAKVMLSRFTPAQRHLIAKLIAKIGWDGHTIWDANVLKGFPPALIARFSHTYKSDTEDPKGMITSHKTGKLLKELEGVYGLPVLSGICADLGLKTEGALGRGTQARIYTAAITEWLTDQDPNDAEVA